MELEKAQQRHPQRFDPTVASGPTVVATAPAPRRLAKSLALVPEEAVHDALAAISDGAAVAFDLRRGADHYFAADGDARIERETARLLEGLSDLTPGAPARLRHLLGDAGLRGDLQSAFALLVATVAQTQTAVGDPSSRLGERRFVVMHQGHVLFDAGLILDHAGAQTRTGTGPGRPTIYLPLDLLTFVGHAGADAQEGLRFLLEHADFHLRDNPGGVVIGGHPYSSPEEQIHIDRLWGQHRRALVSRCRAQIDLMDGGAAAYWTTVLYLLGAIDMVMADQVPVLLQRLETTGDDLAPAIPQMHAAFVAALASDDVVAEGAHATRWKAILLASVDRSVTSILDQYGIALSADLRAQIDRPSAGVLAIRRTLNDADLADVARALATIEGDGRPRALERGIACIQQRSGGDDLARAGLALAGQPGRPNLEQLADNHLLNRHEARLLGGLAALADRGSTTSSGRPTQTVPRA